MGISTDWLADRRSFASRLSLPLYLWCTVYSDLTAGCGITRVFNRSNNL